MIVPSRANATPDGLESGGPEASVPTAPLTGSTRKIAPALSAMRTSPGLASANARWTSVSEDLLASNATVRAAVGHAGPAVSGAAVSG